jgi:dolichol kinase
VLRAAGEAETTQENIQNWLDLDEGHLRFQLLTEEEIAAVIFFVIILLGTTYIIKFSIYLFSKFLLVFQGNICFINQDHRLIRVTSPQINLD